MLLNLSVTFCEKKNFTTPESSYEKAVCNHVDEIDDRATFFYKSFLKCMATLDVAFLETSIFPTMLDKKF